MSDHFDHCDFHSYEDKIMPKPVLTTVELVASIKASYLANGYLTSKQKRRLNNIVVNGAEKFPMLWDKSKTSFEPEYEATFPTRSFIKETVLGDYKMQLIDTFLAENENFKFVSVVFSPYTAQQEYTYKTLLDVEVDDYVVVQTPNNGYQVVQVRSVMEPLEADLNPNVRYKWVVQKVDFEHFETCKEMEKEVSSRLKKAELRKRQQELRESAQEFLTDEERAETAKLVRL